MNSLRQRIRQALALCALLAASPAALCQQQPWITVSAGGEQRILDDGAKQTLTVVVALNGVKRERVALDKILVRRDNVVLPDEVAKGFQIAGKLAAVGSAHVAHIIVQPDMITRPGNYEVWISARVEAAGAGSGTPGTGAERAATPSPELLKITVEHPSATLEVMEPVKIRIVRGEAPEEATPLKLRLKGDVVRLTNPVLDPVTFPDAKDPVSASLKLKGGLVSFDSNKALEREWAVTGRFPLGTLEGTAQIRGDQLKDPLSFKISVRTTGPMCWLYLAAAGGLLAGFGVKILLANYLELRRARAEGQQMLREMQRQLRNQPDESLAAALHDSMQKLNGAVRSGKKVEIEAQVTAAKDALAAQLQFLRTKQQERKTEIDEWIEAVTPERDLPDAVREGVSLAAKGIRDAAALVMTSVAKAGETLDATRSALLRKLRDEVGSWRAEMIGHLQKLGDAASTRLPLDVVSAVSAQAVALGKELSDLNLTSASAESVGTLLTQVERIRSQADDGPLYAASDGLRSSVKSFLARIAPLVQTDPSIRTSLESALADAQTKLREGTVEQRLQVLRPGEAEELGELDEQFQKVIRSFAADKKEDQEAIAEFVKRRDYLSAATKFMEALAAKATATGDKDFLLGAEQASAEARLQSEPVVTTGRVARTLQVRSYEKTPLGPLPPLNEVEMSLTRTWKEIGLAEFVQSLVIGLLFVLLAHVVYADKFVGTSGELIGIFFWAFGLDLTVAKVIEAAKAPPK